MHTHKDMHTPSGHCISVSTLVQLKQIEYLTDPVNQERLTQTKFQPNKHSLNAPVSEKNFW